MLYREVGQYKTSYAADMAVFPILQDRIGIGVILLVAFVGIPLVGNDFLLQAVMIPFLIFSLAAIGLNLLTGYTGLLSLGTGAFMGVGAYACLKLTTYFPQVNIIVWIIASGFFSAAVGVLFGLPSLAHQGFLPGGGDAGRRSSFSSGASFASPGSITTPSPARSKCRNVRSPAYRSPVRRRRRSPGIWSCCASWW